MKTFLCVNRELIYGIQNPFIYGTLSKLDFYDRGIRDLNFFFPDTRFVIFLLTKIILRTIMSYYYHFKSSTYEIVMFVTPQCTLTFYQRNH